MFEQAELADLTAFRFGHAQNLEAATGCTVIVAPQGAVCGIDVRGGGPATRETDLLKPENMIQAVHAIVLSGGSAFGLEASSGVMESLVKRDIGFALETVRVPIVVGACLFDLLVGKNTYPDKAMGSKATEAALEGLPFGEGIVGAGTGATVGKLLGSDRAMKSGFGFSVLRFGELVVGALVAVNAIGNIRAEDGSWIAGCRAEDGTVMDGATAFGLTAQAMAAQSQAASPCANTTIGAIVTNGRITKAEATKISSTCHDAYARAIKPVHTSNDGDAIFTFASGEVDTMSDLVA
ncbi:MAG: P1 family peptidase, partial [Raoultibacter sp.]